jgi:hypothetical protein
MLPPEAPNILRGRVQIHPSAAGQVAVAVQNRLPHGKLLAKDAALMAHSTVEEIIDMASRLSQADQQRIIAELSAVAVSSLTGRLDVHGWFAHVPTSVDDFLGRKATEIELESRSSDDGGLR